MASFYGPSMDQEDERRMYKNWAFLKNELKVDELVEQMVQMKVLTENHKRDIRGVVPNTRLMRADKFLHVLIKSGLRGYSAFTELLRRDSNRYKEVMECLEISVTPPPSTETPNRPNSEASGSTAASSKDGETGERKRRQQRPGSTGDLPIAASNSESNDTNSLIPLFKSNVSITDGMSEAGDAAGAASPHLNDGQIAVDMRTVERELVQIAPTIADLLQRISDSHNTLPERTEEFQKVRNENETLRKTNRALVERLNAFQQKIIHLQLENKRLRDTGEGANETKIELEKKATELESLRKKLEDQKLQLEEKENELNLQLCRIKEIEEENENQKLEIMKLQVLHDEGAAEREVQKDQIAELRKQREKQQERIEILEDIQQDEEERLELLERRLQQLENYGTPRYYGAPRYLQSYQRTTSKPKRNTKHTRMITPPAMPWMNGLLNKSHHANLKFAPPNPRDSKKGWSF